MDKEIFLSDNWQELKKLTDARIALGRVGVSLPLQECLNFKLAHAHAKDAVFSQLDVVQLSEALKKLDCRFYLVHSNAENRAIYLQRPDYGRMLNEESYKLLENITYPDNDICFVISDGLSARAVNENALPLLSLLIPMLKEANYTIAPIVIAQEARVAIADDIGYLLKSKMVINLIGERPGLSSSDSMGAYLTYEPIVGLTDERRNCISNIRPQGLKVENAASKIFYLIQQAFQLRTSGVLLKDNTGNNNLIEE